MRLKLISFFSGILILWLTGCAENVSAERGRPTVITARSVDDDTIPTPIGFVNDFDNFFTDAEEEYLDSLITRMENETSIECAVITVPSGMVTSTDFDSFILEIANTWGVGKKAKGNGIVIGLSKSHKKIRIENGKGIELILSNDETKLAIDSIFIPAFKNEKYFQGTSEGIIYLFQKLKSGYK